eukprot:GGOE01037180.1.p1 GENE.GGOE01037180.1~~GGOE01037180.1.p1  ORF type:complete len:449 (+),score=103.22 GGOE01037180.1:66-1412(+)
MHKMPPIDVDPTLFGLSSWEQPDLLLEADRAIRFHARRLPDGNPESFAQTINHLQNHDPGQCKGDLYLLQLRLHMHDETVRPPFVLKVLTTKEPYEIADLFPNIDLVFGNSPVALRSLIGSDVVHFELYQMVDPADNTDIKYTGDSLFSPPLVAMHAQGEVLELGIHDAAGQTRVGHLEVTALWRPHIQAAIQAIADGVLHGRVVSAGPQRTVIADWRTAATLRLPGLLWVTRVWARFNQPRCVADEPHLYVLLRVGSRVVYRSRPKLNCEPLKWYQWQPIQGDKPFEGVLVQETLTIGLYDADPCSEEEFIGAASVPLMEVLSGERRWFLLQHPIKHRPNAAALFLDCAWAGQPEVVRRVAACQEFFGMADTLEPKVHAFFFRLMNDPCGWLEAAQVREMLECWERLCREEGSELSAQAIATQFDLLVDRQVLFPEFAKIVRMLPLT